MNFLFAAKEVKLKQKQNLQFSKFGLRSAVSCIVYSQLKVLDKLASCSLFFLGGGGGFVLQMFILVHGVIT